MIDIIANFIDKSSMIIVIIFCYLSIFFYIIKKSFHRFLICIGFLFIILEYSLNFGLLFLIKNDSVLWQLIDLLFEFGVLLIIIGFGILVFIERRMLVQLKSKK